MVQKRGNSNIKIGYMPLAHETYWKFFPNHKAAALNLARQFKDYLSQFGTVYETGHLIDSMARSNEARLHFQTMDVDVIILATITFSTPDDVLLDLKKFSRPTIVWNTQASSTVSSDLNFAGWMLEHGITGVPGVTNLLIREKIPYFLISGHHSSKLVKQNFTTILKAIGVSKHIWGARIGMFGHTYPGMIDFGYDPTAMYSKFGVATVPVLDSAILAAFKKVDKKKVHLLEKELRRKYDVTDEFKGNEFNNSVRLAIAMKNVVRDKKLNALTVYCQTMWQNPEIGVVSCIGNSLLAQEGVFCTCEGDIPTALSGMILDKFSNLAIFTEIWSNDFDNDQFLMGHSGQMNLKLFEGNTKSVKLSRHPWWVGCHGRGACLQLKMPTGEATMLSICSTQDGGWRMIVSTVNVVDRKPIPLGAPNFFIKMNQGLPEFLEAWSEAGSGHHLAMAYGNWASHLRALAKIMNVEYKYI